MIELQISYHDAKMLKEYLEQFQTVHHLTACNEINCMYNVTEEVISQICDATGLPRFNNENENPHKEG